MSSRILSRLSRARHGLTHHRVALLSPLRQDQVQCTSYGLDSMRVAAAGPSAKVCFYRDAISLSGQRPVSSSLFAAWVDNNIFPCIAFV